MNRTILYICRDYPYPPDAGNRVDMYGRVQYLIQTGWDVVGVVVMAERARQCRTYGSLPLPPATMEWHEILHDHSMPSARELAKIASGIQYLIDQHRPAVIWYEYAHLTPVASRLDPRGARVYFRSVNFELGHYLEKALDRFPSGRWKTECDSIPKALRLVAVAGGPVLIKRRRR